MHKLTLILFLLLSTGMSSCQKKLSSETQNSVINVPLTGDISTLDPANSYDVISALVVYQVYEQLYQYHYLKRPFQIIPLLADGMPKVSQDGKRYTIKIKKGIRYHDDPSFKGQIRYVKAQDFITQIKRLQFKPTRSNGSWLFDGRIVGINKFRDTADTDFEKFKSLNVEGLKAIDDHTLEINLTKPFPQMLYALAMSFTSPMPMEALEAYKNNLNLKMVGTGPFYLESSNPIHVNLKKFEHYRKSVYPGQGDRFANSKGFLLDANKPIPFLDGIRFHIIKESNTRWLNFRKAKIDFLIVPKDNLETTIDPTGNLSEELKANNISLQVVPTLTYWWLSFNMNDPLLGKNKNLRLAIAHSVNANKYIKYFTNNVGQKANSIYPPGIFGYDPTNELPYKYNKAKAKEYLKKAGFPDGKGLPELTFDVRGANATHRQQADFIKNELEQVGIKVKVELNTFPAFLKKSRNGELQFWFDGWAMDYPDAENSLQLLYSKNHPPGPNATYYQNKEFDKLFEQLKLMTDTQEKKKIMKRMEEIVLNDLPWVMLYYKRSYILYHDHLKNYRESDIIYNYMKYLKKSL